MKSDFLLDFINKVEGNSEQSLWRAVILQAFIDLKNNSKKKIAKTYRLKSALWFNLKNEDFLLTCDYAGFDPRYVHKFAEVIKDSFFIKKNIL